MRFDQFNIPAYGPFTNFQLDLPKNDADIHLIQGENEAGKSSLLRAIHHFLYGIPARTEDNFLHDYNKLKIGATICTTNAQLTAFRKKGNTNTLTDAQSEVVEEHSLRSLFGNVSEEFFRHMFGLNTQQLRDGAELLLAGQGEIGTLLFSASLGGNRIDKAIAKLQDEAYSLARGGSRTNVRIPEALRAYDEALQLVKDHTMSPKQWATLIEELQAAEERFAAQDRDYSELSQRDKKIAMLLQTLPLITHRGELLENINAIDLPELADDFADRVRKAQSTLFQADTSLTRMRRNLDSSRSALAALPEFQKTIAAAAEIEAIHQDFPRYKAWQDDADNFSQEITSDESSLPQLLKQAGIASLDELANDTISNTDLDELTDLAENLSNTASAQETTQTTLANSRLELEAKNESLKSLTIAEFSPQLSALSKSIDRYNNTLLPQANSHRNDLVRQQNLRDSIADNELQLENDLETIRELTIPQRGTIEPLVTEREQLDDEVADLQKSMKPIKRKIAALTSELERFSRGARRIVTADDLQTQRTERDTAWKAFKSAALSGGEITKAAAKSVTDKIAVSDEIADQLLNDAEATAQAAHKQAELEREQAALDQLQQEQDQLTNSLADWKSRWNDTTSFTEELVFEHDAILDWIDAFKNWHTADLEIRNLESAIASFEEKEATLIADLQQALNSEEPDLETLMEILRHKQSAAERAQGQASTLRTDIAALKTSIKEQSSRLDKATTHNQQAIAAWQKAADDFKFDPEIQPRTQIAKMRSSNEMQVVHLRLKANRTNLDSIKTKIAGFETQLASAFSSQFPDHTPAEFTVTRQETMLWSHLSVARENQIKFTGLEETLRIILEEIDTEEVKQAETQKQLETLTAQAGKTAIEDLENVLLLHSKRSELQSKLTTLEEQLRHHAKDQPLESFVETCSHENTAALESEQPQLVEQLTRSKEERDAALSAFNDLKKQKAEAENAGNQAAAAKQEAENTLAMIVSDTERFVRLHHAIDFLKAQIEAYREKAQGPLVKKTSEYFHTLTIGSFSGVAARPDANGSIQLVALRPASDPSQPADEVTTEALSEGTRDQLFLALRLAAIDHHLENHPPMPLILDDVLMTFDDERSAALFKALKPLAEKTQVLIFTHHAHLAQIARTSMDDQVTHHTLPRLDLSAIQSDPPSTANRQPGVALATISEAECDTFLTVLRNCGGKAGNTTLREKLGWDEPSYNAVKDQLVNRGAITPGRGRGGSVSIVEGH